MGDEFFGGLARDVRHPHAATHLSVRIWRSLRDFVEGYASGWACRIWPTSLGSDWALNAAFSPAEPVLLPMRRVGGVPPELCGELRFMLAPSSRLVSSRYPIDRIWTAAQPGASNETVELACGDARLLVLRRPDDAGFVALGQGEASFLEALAVGHTLEEASAMAASAEAVFDLSSSFARLLALRAFAALQ